MRTRKSTYSGPGIDLSWDEFPEEAKTALRDLEIGETAKVFVPDKGREYELTLVERIEAEELDR